MCMCGIDTGVYTQSHGALLITPALYSTPLLALFQPTKLLWDKLIKMTTQLYITKCPQKIKVSA